MSIQFRARDYCHPLRLYRMHRFLAKSQWYEPERLAAWQRERLRFILRHAYDRVPYYRELFTGRGLCPEDIGGPEDLGRLPVLDRRVLREQGRRLQARGMERYGPVRQRTSGTTGEPVEFFLDRDAHVLEFCYYWRYWSWAGYRLGRPFAELGLEAFLARDPRAPVHWSRLTRKLDLNAALLSEKNLGSFVQAMHRHRVAFLKGPPSGLQVFARLLDRQGSAVELRAVFTTGETLLPGQRAWIEKSFHCPVLDSYGHMERTVGICQCPAGGYHINSDYGLLEIEKNDRLSTPRTTVGNVIGTSLHNLAMPLIRYRIGDLIEIRNDREPCSCGRKLPLCERIIGRTQDVIITADGRYVTNAFIIFNSQAGVSWFQIVQHELDRFEIKVEAREEFTRREEEKVKEALHRLVGPARISLERVAEPVMKGGSDGKYRSVLSLVDQEALG